MVPFALFILNRVCPDQTEERAAPTGPWHKKENMTLIQVQALNGLKKGNIRSADYGVLALRKGVYGRGEKLFKANFRPGAGSSWYNASKLCQEAARTLFDFELLFVQTLNHTDTVRVLCPACRSYWTWETNFKNDLRRPSGRLCTRCVEQK